MKRAVWLVISVLLGMVVFVPSGMSEESVPPVPAEPAAVKPLRLISSFDAPPFAYVEAGRKIGFEVDLGEAIGKVLGRPVEWLQRPFNIPALASELNAGRADAILASMTATGEREQYFIFTIPYYRTSLTVATFRDVDWDHTAFRDGLSKAVRVGVLRRTTGEAWAQKNLQATRETFETPARLARALNDREVAMILVDAPILRWELAKRHYKFKVVEQGIDRQDYAIAVGRSNPAMVGELNGALKKLERDGVYGEIYRKWYETSARLPEIGK